MKQCICSITLTLLIIGTCAATDLPEGYRIIDLGPLGYSYSPVTFGDKFSINQHGQVAFARDLDDGNGIRGAVWLPHAAYHLAHGEHELPVDILGAPSFARDINDVGLVVGQVDGRWHEGVRVPLVPADNG